MPQQQIPRCARDDNYPAATFMWCDDCYNRRVFCCAEFADLVDREMARVAPKHRLGQGRIVNDIDTEYFLLCGEGGTNFVGINYCPFCGRVVSRELWNREKKK